jgi:methyltransferase (TIGR00027 family)
MTGFTHARSTDPARIALRTGAGLLPASEVVDAALGVIFIPVVALLSVPILFLMILSAPFFRSVSAVPLCLARMRGKGGAGVTNISTTKGGSRTARFVLQMRALGAGMGFGPEWMAPLFALCRESHPSASAYVAFCVFYRLATSTFYITRRSVFPTFKLLGILPPKIPDGLSYLQMRTCWLDDALSKFLEKPARGGGGQVQVVALGAGYDSRAYRFRGARFFEVDAVGTQQSKVRMLDKLGIDRRHVAFVAVDFERDCWVEALCDSGFDLSVPTCFILEGVSYYLTASTFDATLSKVTRCAAGSIICFDYFTAAVAFNPSVDEMFRRIGEPLQFGMSSADSDVAAFLSRPYVRLRLLENITSEEAKFRYLPLQGEGRQRYIGSFSDFGGFVVAST